MHLALAQRGPPRHKCFVCNRFVQYQSLRVAEGALFVRSALAEAALDRNVEVGVLLRDRTIVPTALAHFRGLIDQRLLLPLH